MNEIPLDRKTKEELLEYIENMKSSSTQMFNTILVERDKLRKEVRDLKLKVQCLEKFKDSISKNLDKLIKDLQ